MHGFGLLLVLSQTATLSSGTVFLEGDVVLVSRPKQNTTGLWRALDDRWNEVASGTWGPKDKSIELGSLPVGWYRIDFLDQDSMEIGFTTAAVLARLAETVPDSPVAVDVALSWVPERDPQVWRLCTNLARLAGITMVRDRVRWREIQPEPNTPLLHGTVYDQTADLQNESGLQILQVFHDSPPWTWIQGEGRGRIPADLRDTWQFCRDVASHFRGRVQAWQPWNEGNVRNFGGHTMDELCSHQKAAYLGFRAGNPDVQICWAPMAGVHTEGHFQGMTANGVSPYFDIFTFHSYDWCHAYWDLRAWVVKAASGKPIWVTECDRGITADPDSPVGDLNPQMERLKAEFITQSIVSSLATGASRHFHFILPQYLEQNNTVQFGLLRHDNTPRMGYVALAAAGRFLAGASYLGRTGDPALSEVYVFAFRSLQNGEERDLLVAWTEAPVDWPDRGHAVSELRLEVQLKPVGVWDYMGRFLGTDPVKELTSAPVYIMLPKGSTDSLTLRTPALPKPFPLETPCPVVLQLNAPDMPLRERFHDWSYEYDRTVTPGENEFTLSAYHFGQGIATGRIRVMDLPAGWHCEPHCWDVILEPMERHEQRVTLRIPEAGPPFPNEVWLHMEGDLGSTGKARLAFRVSLPQT